MGETSEIILEGFAPPDQVGGYLHLPFDVPPGTSRLEVHYDYSSAIGAEQHLTGGNTVDIGLFDQRGVGFNSEGFRGWSGSDRAGFFLATDKATPGYMPGPIEPGTWYIILGLYKMAPDGCHYKVKIRLSHDTNVQPAAFPPLLTVDMPAAPIPVKPDGWYRGELHCHTIYSDGDSRPADLITTAEGLGLDFLAITDHNVLCHLADPAMLHSNRLILIPGFEVTTYKGHWNIWGGKGWVDFRIGTPEQLERSVQQAARQGYLTSCNHPRTYGPPWEFGTTHGIQCVEVWNGPWQLFNEEALAFWENRLRAGERIPAVGGSDMHHMKEPEIDRLGTPTTWIYCSGTPSAAGLLAGLQAGHAFISDAPDGPQLYLTSGEAMMGDCVQRLGSGTLPVQVRVVNGAGLVLELYDAKGCRHSAPTTAADQTFRLSLPVGETPYLRAQLIEPEQRMVRALTNPLYVQ